MNEAQSRTIYNNDAQFRGGWADDGLVLHLYIITTLADRGIVALTHGYERIRTLWGKRVPYGNNVNGE